MAKAKPSKYNNYSPEMLADEYGDAGVTEKAAKATKEALKTELLRRGTTSVTTDKYALTVSDSSSTRLDTKKLTEDLGASTLAEYYRTTEGKTVRCPKVGEEDGE